MKQAEDKKTRDMLNASSPGARRQAALRERREAEGRRLVRKWVVSEDYERGRIAGELGSKTVTDVPTDADAESWCAGYCAGVMAYVKAEQKRRACSTPP